MVLKQEEGARGERLLWRRAGNAARIAFTTGSEIWLSEPGGKLTARSLRSGRERKTILLDSGAVVVDALPVGGRVTALLDDPDWITPGDIVGLASCDALTVRPIIGPLARPVCDQLDNLPAFGTVKNSFGIVKTISTRVNQVKTAVAEVRALFP